MTEGESERLINESYAISREDTRCESWITKATYLGHQIMERLGNSKDLFLEYEICTGLITGTCIDNAYHMGLKQGLYAQQNAQQIVPICVINDSIHCNTGRNAT